MIWLTPHSVTLLGTTFHDVRAVAVSRHASGIVEEHGDAGPYAVFVDTPNIVVEIVIEREITREAAGVVASPAPGETGTLSLTSAPANSSAHAESIEGQVVVTSVRHKLNGGNGPVQIITCRGVSPDGAEAPLTAAGKK